MTRKSKLIGSSLLLVASAMAMVGALIAVADDKQEPTQKNLRRQLTEEFTNPAGTRQDEKTKQNPLPKKAKSAKSDAAADAKTRKQGLIASVTIFVLAIFVGFEMITKVPPTLHTPLMSGSNAISGITMVGALLMAGRAMSFSSFVGMLALALATINVVGGFWVTHRMLAMFQRK